MATTASGAGLLVGIRLAEGRFSPGGTPEFDLERTGGLHVAVDETFAAATWTSR